MSVLLTFTFFNVSVAKAGVSNIPYETYSFGLKGELVSTATAYEGTFILNDGFKNPSDLYIFSEEINGEKFDLIYIADTDNKRIYEYNPQTQTGREIGIGVLESPTGVFVDRNKDIYVADSKHNKIFWFNDAGDLVKEYGRPDEALFGDDAPYLPLKVIVDARKNLYVVSSEGTNGIIQMDVNGDFLGYYGVNKVYYNFSLFLNRLIMSKEERENSEKQGPKATTNIAIDQSGLVYTVIDEIESSIKKLNIEGNNVLTGRSFNDQYYQDIFVGQDGMIYAVSNNFNAKAVVSVHDNQGNLIFVFGERKQGSLRIGEFGNPVGIATDSNGDIWILDQNDGNVQVFTKTEFASMVMSAINYYNDGKYDESKALFQEVVRQNAMFSLAHSSLGKLYQRDNEFELALESYRIANNKFGYSEVFWELRDQWIADNLIYMLALGAVSFVAYLIFKHQKENIKGYHFVKEKINELKNKKFYFELKLLRKILKDPLDVVYEIKFRQSVRIRTAAIFYVIFIFLNIITNYFIKGYLFRGDTDNIVLTFEILKWFLPLFLLGIANHLMNSLQSGEAFYRDLFIGIIYAMAPILLFKLPLDLISNVLTYNEAFIFQLAYLVIYAWTVINVVVVIKELNNYKASQLIINLVLTVFSMLIMIVLYLVINVLTTQLISFIQGILQEVF